MRDDRPSALSLRQFAALSFAALLSPLIRQIPATLTAVSGKAAFLSAALAFFPAAALAWVWSLLLRRRAPGEDAAALLCRALGVPGRVILLLFSLWLLFYGGFVLRAGADRFAAAVYPESPVWVFMAVMLLLLLPAVPGRARTLGRCAAVLAPVLGIILAAALLFALPDAEAENLLPLRPQDLSAALRGVFPAADTLCIALYLLFLAPDAAPDGLRRAQLPPLAVCAALAVLLCLATIGSFGASLTEKMNYPFFVLIRSVRVFHLLERIEALVVVQWLAADFLLLGALGQIAARTLSCGIRGAAAPTHRLFALPVLGGMTLFAALCASTTFALRDMARAIIPALNAGMIALLTILYSIAAARLAEAEKRASR